MPAYVWIVAAAAVAFVLWIALARRWLHGVLYAWRRSRHLIAQTQDEDVPAPEYIPCLTPAPEYGSMVLAEEAAFTLHTGYPPFGEWEDAGWTRPTGWREQMSAELSPEALDDAGLCAACIMDDHCDGEDIRCDCTCAWPEDWAGRDEDSGPGVESSSLGPGFYEDDEDPAAVFAAFDGAPKEVTASSWLDGQLAELYAWVRAQWEGAAA